MQLLLKLRSSNKKLLNVEVAMNGWLSFDVYYRAPDKLRISVFYAMKTSKNACIIRSECTFTHTYCCVSKLSKFGAYLYAVDDNTSYT